MARAPLVTLVAKRLEQSGTVSKAPSYALLAVSDGQVAVFKQNVSSLLESFDHLVVLWGAADTAPESTERVYVSSDFDSTRNRWSLLDAVKPGFVFPVDVRDIPSPRQVNHLRRHLNLYGGFSAVTCADPEVLNLDPEITRCGTVETSSISINHVVFDQRYWRLSGSEFDGASEAESFIRAANERRFTILTCSAAPKDLAESTPKGSAASDTGLVLESAE